MAYRAQKGEINLVQSFCTDSISQVIYPFGDPSAKHLVSNGIVREGGLTNQYESKVTLGAFTGNTFFESDNGRLIKSSISGAVNTVSVDGNVVGQVSSYGIARTAVVGSPNDVFISVLGTYVTVTLVANTLVVSEYNSLGLLNTRTIVFSQMPTTLPQIATSLSFVRYNGMEYADSQEWWVRIGDQVLLFQESNLTISLNTIIQSTTAINPLFTGGFTVLCSIAWAPPAPYSGTWLTIAGTSGRLATYDGIKWHNYDGSGGGIGPVNSGTATNSQDINTITVFGSTLVVGANTGLVASWNLAWTNYNAAGTGVSVIASNATAIGANAVKSIRSWNSNLVVAGVAGTVGSWDGAHWYNYNSGIVNALINNGTVIGANAIECMSNYSTSLAFAGDTGKIGSVSVNSSTFSFILTGLGSIYSNPIAGTNGSGTILLNSANGSGLISNNFGASFSAGNLPVLDGSAKAYGFLYVGSATPFWLYFGTLSVVTPVAFVYQSLDNGVTWSANICPAGMGIASNIEWNGSNSLMLVGKAGGSPTCNYSIGTISGTNIAWSATALISNWTTGTPNSVCWDPNNSTWVMVGNSAAGTDAGYSIYSGSWTNYTTYGLTASASMTGICYGNGYLVAGGYASTSTVAIIKYSSNDGSSWSTISGITGAARIMDVAYSPISGFFGSAAAAGGLGFITPVTPNNPSSWNSYTSLFAGSAYFTYNSICVDNFGHFGFPACPTGSNGNYDTFGTAYTWLNFGSASGSNLANNSTVLGANNIYAMVTSSTDLWVGGATGLVGSFSGAAWVNYNNGSGKCSNQTVIGANDIRGITTVGLTVSFAGATGRLGSYDYSNADFKNYDGTGTGTGPFSNQTVVGTNNIFTMSYYGATLIVGSANGAINSISASNIISVLYTNGANLQANIFSGYTDFTYLYAYRYENGYYLLNLVGNVENQAFIVNYVGKALYTIKCQYAIPQVSSGKTRHIITMSGNGNPSAIVALFDGSNSYAAGTVGYTDFSNFSTTTVYPTTGITTATYTIQPLKNSSGVTVANAAVAGHGYAEFNYFQTSTATNIFNFYSPQFTNTPSSSWGINQANTNTPINAYGKLTNAYGVIPAIPVEIRVGLVNNAQQFLSAAPIGSAADNMGVLLTNFGEFDGTYTPHIVGDNTILYRFNGSFFIVSIPLSPGHMIQRIGENIYKVNTISPLNIVDTLNTALDLGSVDYHGQVLFQSTAAGVATAHFFDCLFQGPYSNSIDPGNKFVYINPFSANNFTPLGFQVLESQLVNYELDVYYDNLYLTSVYNDGSKLANQNLLVSQASGIVQGASYSQAVVVGASGALVPVVPVAQGYTYQNKSVTTAVETIFLLQNYNTGLINGLQLVYDGYGIGNQLPGFYQNFILQALNFLFDGEYIWRIDVNNNVLTNKVRVAEAYGMQFISQSPDVAYFLSALDNSIMTFNQSAYHTGLVGYFNKEPDIITGVYGDRDRTLLVYNSSELLWIRDGIIASTARETAMQNLQLFNTTKGIYILGNDGANWYSWQFGYKPVGVVLPLQWQSAYFGRKGDEKSIINQIVLTVFAAAKPKSNVTVYVNTLNIDGNGEQTQTVPFLITPNMWSANGTRVLRVQPQVQRTLGTSVKLVCDTNKITLLSAQYELAGDTIAIPGNSASR